MARAFKFELGDVVKTKCGSRLVVPGDFNKEYQEHLTVIFYFWDGNSCCYVLDTGDDGICGIIEEDYLELEERPPMPAVEEEPPVPAEEVHPEYAKESYFLGYVYRVNNRLVAAEGIEQAIRLFHDHPSHRSETIGKIILQDTDLALIQNGKEE